jgi:pimeloyl-ACP methyl ester carboxylesterase
VNLSDEPTGFIPMPQGAVAYWRVGVPGGRPLVCLHGGPGLPHSYLEPLADLGAEREVIFYDQAGCGRSSRRPPGSSWSIQYFVAEVGEVVAALGLEEFHLFGNSWGGWLALEYVLSEPPAMPVSLCLNSSPPSVARWVTDLNMLRAGMHAEDSREFNRRHMCRLRPWPRALKNAIAGFGDEVYAALWGTSEFGPVTGALKDWDVTPRLAALTLPTLVTCGRHDEATPEHMSVLAAGIAGARFRIFEDSSHMAFLEERHAFITELSSFLGGADE